MCTYYYDYVHFIDENVWNTDLLESAKGSQIYNWAEKEETVEDLGSSSVKASLRHVQDPFYNRRFVKRLDKVAIDDVQALAKKYLPLFEDPELTRTAIVCGSSQVNEIKENFAQYGINLTVIDNLDDSILTQ